MDLTIDPQLFVLLSFTLSFCIQCSNFTLLIFCVDIYIVLYIYISVSMYISIWIVKTLNFMVFKLFTIIHNWDPLIQRYAAVGFGIVYNLLHMC